MGSFLNKNVMEICIAPAPLEVQRFDQIVEKALASHGFTFTIFLFYLLGVSCIHFNKYITYIY